ncbi:CxxC-x17-CxxC domain-containing protein [Nanoarchaeota archaeon]
MSRPRTGGRNRQSGRSKNFGSRDSDGRDGRGSSGGRDFIRGRGRDRESRDRDSRDRPSRDRDSRGSRRDDDRPKFGGRPSRDERYRVICAECGVKCEVPFKPTNNKPVLCSDCFGGGKSKGSRNKGSGSGKQLAEINRKLDKIMKALSID